MGTDLLSRGRENRSVPFFLDGRRRFAGVFRCGAQPLTRQERESFRLTAQHRPEVVTVEEGCESTHVRRAPRELRAADLEWHVARDFSEPAREERGLAVFDELRRELARAAHRDLADL